MSDINTDEKVQVKSTNPLKLKDKDGRRGLKIDFMRDFGFIPDVLYIEKVYGQNNAFILSVTVPAEKPAVKGKKK